MEPRSSTTEGWRSRSDEDADEQPGLSGGPDGRPGSDSGHGKDPGVKNPFVLSSWQNHFRNPSSESQSIELTLKNGRSCSFNHDCQDSRPVRHGEHPPETSSELAGMLHGEDDQLATSAADLFRIAVLPKKRQWIQDPPSISSTTHWLGRLRRALGQVRFSKGTSNLWVKLLTW